MTTKERRDNILQLLKESKEPVAAKVLAITYGVSRQVIVQDMAVIRASVSGIISTNRGYILQADNVCSREFKVKHGSDRLEEELNLIVDCGGSVKNVSISHRIYGRITANMNISSRQDVAEFLEKIKDCSSSLLGNATSGYHYHLIEASNEERLNLIEQKLTEAGFSVPLLPWENDNMGK